MLYGIIFVQNKLRKAFLHSPSEFRLENLQMFIMRIISKFPAITLSSICGCPMLIFLAIQIKKMCHNFPLYYKKSKFLKYENIIIENAIIKTLLILKKLFILCGICRFGFT